MPESTRRRSSVSTSTHSTGMDHLLLLLADRPGRPRHEGGNWMTGRWLTIVRAMPSRSNRGHSGKDRSEKERPGRRGALARAFFSPRYPLYLLAVFAAWFGIWAIRP